MLCIDNERWDSLQGSCGLKLGHQMLKDVLAGQYEQLAELGHQICHQGTVGEIAYAVVPHLAEFARDMLPKEEGLYAINLVGYVQQSRLHYPHSAAVIPADLRDNYFKANQLTTGLIAEMLSSYEHDKIWFLKLLSSLSALKGFSDVSTLLDALDESVSCPSCGETGF